MQKKAKKVNQVFWVIVLALCFTNTSVTAQMQTISQTAPGPVWEGLEQYTEISMETKAWKNKHNEMVFYSNNRGYPMYISVANEEDYNAILAEGSLLIDLEGISWIKYDGEVKPVVNETLIHAIDNAVAGFCQDKVVKGVINHDGINITVTFGNPDFHKMLSADIMTLSEETDAPGGWTTDVFDDCPHSLPPEDVDECTGPCWNVYSDGHQEFFLQGECSGTVMQGFGQYERYGQGPPISEPHPYVLCICKKII